MKRTKWLLPVLPCLLLLGCSGGVSVDSDKGEDEADVAGRVRIDDEGVHVEGSVEAEDEGEEGSGSGAVSIGKDGIRITGGGSGRSGSESGSGSGSISIGPGGIQIQGSGAGTDGTDEGAGSGGVSIGAGGIDITGGGRGSGRAAGMTDVSNCEELCRVWPAVRTRQVECAVVLLEVRGYPVVDTPACEDVEMSRECNVCRRALDLSDADCRAVFETCIARK